MTIATATISGQFVGPDLTGGRTMQATYEAYAVGTVVTYPGVGVIGGRRQVPIAPDGTATITIPKIPQAGLVPSSGVTWKVRVHVRGEVLEYFFPLTADTTWDAVLVPANALAPPGLAGDAIAARDAAVAAAASALSFNGYNVATFGSVGTADDTATFTAAIASGKKNLFVPPGTYIVNGLTMNQAGQSLMLAPGATLRAKTAGSQTIITVTAANVTINALGATIDGNSVGNSAGSTIYVNNVSDCRIIGGSFVNYLGIAVNAQGDRATVTAGAYTNSAGNNTSIFVAGPTTTADLIAPEVSFNKLNITATGAGANGIYISNNTGRVVLRPRVIGNDVTIPASATAGIGITLFGGCVNGTVTGNTTQGGMMGFSIDHGSGTSVTSNTAYGAALNGIEFAGPASSTCTGNTVDGNGLTLTGVSLANVTGGGNVVSGNAIRNLSTLGSGTNGVGIFCQNAAGTNTTISGNSITAFVPVYCKQSGHTVTGNNLIGANSAAQAVALDTVTDAIVANNVAKGFSLAVVNAFSGTMNGLIIGPNILTGGTPADLVNGWTPGTNGTGSRLIRGNVAPAGVSSVTPGASPWTFTNTNQSQCVLYVSGGTVSAIAKNALTIFTTTGASVALEPGETCTVTYSVAPTVRKDVK